MTACSSSTHLGQDLTPSSDRRAAAGLRSTVTATVAAGGGASTVSAPTGAEPELEAIESTLQRNDPTRQERSRLQSAAALGLDSDWFGLYQRRTQRGSSKLIWSLLSPAQRTWTETFATTRRRGAPHLDMSAAGSLVCLLSVAGGAWSDALTLRPVRDVAT